MGQNCQLAHKGGKKKAPVGVVDVLAVALKGGEDLLSAKVEGVRPANVPVLEEENAGVCGIVEPLCEGVAKAGVDHKEGVAEVEGMRDYVLVEENLLLVPPQLLRHSVEVYDAIIDALFIGVVLADPQSL